MFNCYCLNPIFLTCVEGGKDYKPIIISGPRPYNPKVKIHGWEERWLSQPHDNTTGNLMKSTYKRLGTHDDPTGISVTQAMTEQIHTKADWAASEYRHRRLLNIYSFPYTQTEDYKNELEINCDINRSQTVEPTDYRTTLKDDFPWHYPENRVLPISPHHVSPRRWTMWRRTLGYSCEDLERRPGVRHFLDDKLDVKDHDVMPVMRYK